MSEKIIDQSTSKPEAGATRFYNTCRSMAQEAMSCKGSAHDQFLAEKENEAFVLNKKTVHHLRSEWAKDAACGLYTIGELAKSSAKIGDCVDGLERQNAQITKGKLTLDEIKSIDQPGFIPSIGGFQKVQG